MLSRTAQGSCSILYTSTGFETNGALDANANMPTSVGDACSSDFVMIPNAFNTDPGETMDRMCGDALIVTTTSGPIFAGVLSTSVRSA